MGGEWGRGHVRSRGVGLSWGGEGAVWLAQRPAGSWPGGWGLFLLLSFGFVLFFFTVLLFLFSVLS